MNANRTTGTSTLGLLDRVLPLFMKCRAPTEKLLQMHLIMMTWNSYWSLIVVSFQSVRKVKKVNTINKVSLWLKQSALHLSLCLVEPRLWDLLFFKSSWARKLTYKSSLSLEATLTGPHKRPAGGFQPCQSAPSPGWPQKARLCCKDLHCCEGNRWR